MEDELAYQAVAGGARAISRRILAAGDLRGDRDRRPRRHRDGARGAGRPRRAGSRRERADGPPDLSPRELEVLHLIADGLSAPDIGKQIHLSPATVKTHLRSLYEKLGVSDRAAAVAEGMRRGLLE